MVHNFNYLYVYIESIRVEKFQEVCKNDDESSIQCLSKLIKQSHFSLQSLYECSHPNLDKLVEISENFGVNARLTGAGWGGCIVVI